MRRLILIPIIAVILLLPAMPGQAAPPVFTHGVAAGDVTPFSAVVWTRVDQKTTLTVEVSANPAFPNRATIKRTVATSAGDDFTAKALAAPLVPNKTYYYRWSRGSTLSEIGTFRTPPLPWTHADVRFTYSADSDGTKVAGVPAFNNFEVLDTIRAENADFFVYLGDTIYSDSSHRPAPATTLAEYRDAYKLNREYQALRDLLKSTSTYAMWDDHEVYNDYNGETVDDARYANGTKAFLEYMPVLNVRLPDPACEHDPLFRAFRWGKDVDVIIPDERSCRSADVAAACLGDLAPTLPTAVRSAFPFSLFVTPTPPAGCLNAIFDPDRTMLGPLQKKALKALLKHSDAKFKFIINEVPIQQYYALPYDRWEGYGAERNEILNFIRDNDIDNVAFLTTDTHANLINDVAIDTFADPAPIATEFVTGPIATNTLQAEITNTFGPLAVIAFQALLGVSGVDCRNIDINSYGVVDVDSGAGTATITLKDTAGATVTDSLTAAPCTKTLGP